MRKRAALVPPVLLVLLLGGWIALGRPPPRLVLAHGLPPAGGPTGRTRADAFGQEYLEIAPGYRLVEHHAYCEEGDLLGRLCRPLGIAQGVPRVSRLGPPARGVGAT